MAWNAHLSLDYRHDAGRTQLRFSHDGPLRVLQSLYPEGPGVCHSVLVHPPGGLVAGDTLDTRISVAPGAHALISTPGATRFYASTGAAATLATTLELAENARLEWLPLETIAYPGCNAVNTLNWSLAPGAELLAWDVTALGLPGANQPFESGQLQQHLHWPGVWREQAHVRATDTLLLDSPLGWAGQRCLGTLVLACGSPIAANRREHLLDTVRQAIAGHPCAARTGATCPNDRVLVVRCLGSWVEPVMQLLQQIWAQLRPAAWGLQPQAPRIWRV